MRVSILIAAALLLVTAAKAEEDKPLTLTERACLRAVIGKALDQERDMKWRAKDSGFSFETYRKMWIAITFNRECKDPA